MALGAKITVIALGAIALVFAVAVWLGSHLQQRALSQLIEAFIEASSADSARVDFDGFADLPAPVVRYFSRVFPRGQPNIRLAQFRQVGALRTDIHSDRWLPFEASQIVAPAATGFLWNARVDIAPFLHVRVRDALIAGRGSGHVLLLSAFTVASDGGTLEMNSGALHRYLAEAVWFPTALIPSTKLRWSAIDDNTALATLTDNGVTVALEFRFNAMGEVIGIYTPARWGSFNGSYKQLPWEGHFRNYQARGGIFVPSEAEVGWCSEGHWLPVWKGTVMEAKYDLAH
jgi:hypothetical protein